jgi:hypothetical protein
MPQTNPQVKLRLDGQLSHKECNTVLAALRLFQTCLGKTEEDPIEVSITDILLMEHFEDGEEPLTETEIDMLCERINLGPLPEQIATEALACIPVRVGGELKSHLAFVRSGLGIDSHTLCLKSWTRKSGEPFSAKYDCAECCEKQEAAS